MTRRELLERLVNHPEVINWVAPGLAHVDVEPLDRPGALVFGDDLGAVLFLPLDEAPGHFEMHYLFTAARRGKEAVTLIREAFRSMFTEHDATAICGAVPREHRASRVMSRALGGRPLGTHTDHFGRSCIVYVLERKSWATSSAVSGR